MPRTHGSDSTTHFLKTRKEESKKVIDKYARCPTAKPAIPRSLYNAMVKLHNRVPLVTREGTEVQLKEVAKEGSDDKQVTHEKTLEIVRAVKN